jgi:hypothetical protein
MGVGDTAGIGVTSLSSPQAAASGGKTTSSSASKQNIRTRAIPLNMADISFPVLGVAPLAATDYHSGYRILPPCLLSLQAVKSPNKGFWSIMPLEKDFFLTTSVPRTWYKSNILPGPVF